MTVFRFRNQRIDVAVPVNIYLLEKRSNSEPELYKPGLIINLSSEGACVVVDSMILDGKHLFFSTQELRSHHLLLQFPPEDDQLADARLRAVSMWMDSCIYNENTCFKMGICFLEKQKEFYLFWKKRVV